MNSSTKLFLLDAYALIYRAYYAFIKNPRVNSKGMNTSAILGFVNTLEEVLSKEKPTHIGVAFDPHGPTFRHEAYPKYKAQREATPEDIRLSVPYIKDIIRAYHIPILEVAGFEADDVIGTLATQAAAVGIDTYMMTPDKDYGQLVGESIRMYRPKHTGGFEVMGPEEVKAKYGLSHTGQVVDLLGLMGDSSDNIPGCPGVGEKTAQRLLSEFGSIDELLANTDRLKGALKKKVEEHREDIVFSRFLATIRTDVPIVLDMDLLALREADTAALGRIYEELEFRTMLTKLQARQSQGSRVGESYNKGVTPGKTNTSTSFGRGRRKGDTPPPQPDLFSQPDLFGQDRPAQAAEKAQATGRQSAVHAQQLDLFMTADGRDTAAEIAEFPAERTDEGENAILRRFDAAQVNYQLIDTKEKIVDFVQKLLTTKILAFDTETTGIEPMRVELVGMSFAAQEGEAYYLPTPPDREEAQKVVDLVRPLLENPNSLKVGQNIKYDLIVLSHYGLEVRGPMFDTMLAHYVLQPELRHNMDYLAEVYLHYRTIHIEELIGPRGREQKNMRDLSPEDIRDYACEDADVCLRLYHVLDRVLRQKEAYTLFNEIEMPLVPVLTRMETNGVRIDTEALRQTSVDLSARMRQIEEEIYALAGEKFNIASPRQVGEVLFDHLHIVEKAKKTKTGQYVTNEEVLEGLRAHHPVVGRILDHRGLKKLLGTYVDALPQLINPSTGRIHTSFNQAVTATGRLSSSNPNLQNIPVRDADGKEIRRAFIPDDGCEFFSADYSQIELRIMAHLSGDPGMLEAFRSGHDIHAATAARIHHVDLADVTADMRRKAKTANFGIIYGISAFGLAERMSVSRKEAKELIDGYFATYPGVKTYMDRCINLARERGYVETIFHRRRYLPDIQSRNATVRGYAERNAINAPIQGSAADIIKVAMARIHQKLFAYNLKAKMILQVHDELNFSVPIAEKDVVQRIVIEEMENAYPLSVPLKADFGWGKNWLEAH